MDRMLIRHEGNRLKPYRDTIGKLTIGVGRNLDDVGISAEESYFLLEHDRDRAIAHCRKHFAWFDALCPARQMVMVDMCYNLGIGGLLGFFDTLAAIERGDFTAAARHMLKSDWAKQVGNRAIEDAYIMETGIYIESVV